MPKAKHPCDTQTPRTLTAGALSYPAAPRQAGTAWPLQPPLHPSSPLPCVLSTILAGCLPWLCRCCRDSVEVLLLWAAGTCLTRFFPVSQGHAAPMSTGAAWRHPASPGASTSNTLFLPPSGQGRQRLNSSAPGQGETGQPVPCPVLSPGAGGQDVLGSQPAPWELPGHSTQHILSSLRQCWGLFPPPAGSPHPSRLQALPFRLLQNPHSRSRSRPACKD